MPGPDDGANLAADSGSIYPEDVLRFDRPRMDRFMNDATTPRHIFRWDLDKTYLQTEFSTIGGLVRTALQSPEDKTNIPGAVELLRELRHSLGDDCLVTFISGSPSQMRSTIERKFEIDGIEPDLFVLKPTLRYLLKGQVEAVRSQVGYKLETLLHLRAQTPIAPETMFGDDAEQDAFIYSLYADLAAGHISADRLRAILDEAETLPESTEAIVRRARELEPHATVERIFIHLEDQSPPGRFRVFGPRLVPVTNYFQAAVVLFADEVLSASSTLRVAAGMVDHCDSRLLSLASSVESLMRRRHLTPEVVERLADTLSDEDPSDLPEGFTARFISSTRSLAPLEEPEPIPSSQPPDYLEILNADRALRASVREQSGWFQRWFGHR